jgi:hypothetical protein
VTEELHQETEDPNPVLDYTRQLSTSEVGAITAHLARDPDAPPDVQHEHVVESVVGRASEEDVGHAYEDRFDSGAGVADPETRAITERLEAALAQNKADEERLRRALGTTSKWRISNENARAFDVMDWITCGFFAFVMASALYASRTQVASLIRMSGVLTEAKSIESFLIFTLVAAGVLKSASSLFTQEASERRYIGGLHVACVGLALGLIWTIAENFGPALDASGSSSLDGWDEGTTQTGGGLGVRFSALCLGFEVVASACCWWQIEHRYRTSRGQRRNPAFVALTRSLEAAREDRSALETMLRKAQQRLEAQGAARRSFVGTAIRVFRYLKQMHVNTTHLIQLKPQGFVEAQNSTSETSHPRQLNGEQIR